MISQPDLLMDQYEIIHALPHSQSIRDHYFIEANIGIHVI